MVEFQKTGRVFYGRNGGRISELVFQNTEINPDLLTRVQNKVMGEKKRLYKVEHQKESIAMIFVPNFLKKLNSSYTKRLHQMTVDEQRNLLYSLSYSEHGWTEGHAVIEIIDLG